MKRRKRKSGCGYTVPTMGGYRREKGSVKGYHEREEGIGKENSEEIREQGGTSCKLF